MRKTENLSRRQREATPRKFAEFLLLRVRMHFPGFKVAVLWTQRKSVWWRFWPHDVVLYGVGQNARTYRGPYPVICHPPCGPWGKYAHRCKQSREDGIAAIRLVHEFGGVIEQPLGSQLFNLWGRPGSVIERHNQSDFGHPAMKPTILYFVSDPC